MTATAFLEALRADTAASARGDKMDLYGWLVGSWDLDVTRFGEDGSVRRRPGEWHFGWVLEGRAIQDVWIVPARSQQAKSGGERYYGSTLRTYDPRIDAWHIQWTDPASQNYLTMVGRREGDDIVQLGKTPDGNLARWSFSEIRSDSFLWRGEISTDAGTTWRCHVEFRARRRAEARSREEAPVLPLRQMG